ncbi:unnamed protein product [Mytilus coruscus]|uniref:Retrotransposon gag domain-containing protein n=1 Tax=Mytilus coruscus TaxID=42192 RepID=A0A6J8BPV7_MYTCO|nr:unnamed protein product [Mytilus coruscus]
MKPYFPLNYSALKVIRRSRKVSTTFGGVTERSKASPKTRKKIKSATQDTIRPEARVHQQTTESTASTSTAPTTSTIPVLSTETTSTVTTTTASIHPTASTSSTTSTASTASTPAVVQVIREVSVNMPSGINLNAYDGKSSAAQWWGYFIRWTLIQKMCEQQQCNSFPFFMADGIPKQWFATLSETVQNSLQQLKDEFFKRFEKSQGLFDVNILQLKQGQNERVDEFMARLQEKTIGQDIPDNIKIGIAIQGFRGEIGKTVHNTFPKPATLEQLRAIAENAEKSEQLAPASSITADTIAAILEAKMQEPWKRSEDCIHRLTWQDQTSLNRTKTGTISQDKTTDKELVTNNNIKPLYPSNTTFHNSQCIMDNSTANRCQQQYRIRINSNNNKMMDHVKIVVPDKENADIPKVCMIQTTSTGLARTYYPVTISPF